MNFFLRISTIFPHGMLSCDNTVFFGVISTLKYFAIHQGNLKVTAITCEITCVEVMVDLKPCTFSALC